MERLVSRKAWKAISTESVVTKLLDAEILAGRLTEDEVADAINIKDRKPSVRVK